MLNGNPKPDEDKLEAGQLEKIIELELMQKRVRWQQARVRRGKFRALAYFFLLLGIAVALVAFFLLFSGKAGGAQTIGFPCGTTAGMKSWPAMKYRDISSCAKPVLSGKLILRDEVACNHSPLCT